MAMMPKRVKYRKMHRGRIKGNATRGNTVAYGEFGLQSLEAGRITARQIEAGRVSATHFLRREGKVYIRIFPHLSITSKPLETRMGKGKGEPEAWVARVRPGTMLYELGGVEENVARQALARISAKMPCKCRMVHRRHGL